MERNSNEFKQLVYDLMNGSLEIERCPVAESKIVANEYTEGSLCDEAYKKVYEASERLCERLGVPFGEDEDVECIINNLSEIQELLCMKMYEYGWLFSKDEEK